MSTLFIIHSCVSSTVHVKSIPLFSYHNENIFVYFKEENLCCSRV